MSSSPSSMPHELWPDQECSPSYAPCRAWGTNTTRQASSSIVVVSCGHGLAAMGSRLDPNQALTGVGRRSIQPIVDPFDRARK